MFTPELVADDVDDDDVDDEPSETLSFSECSFLERFMFNC